MQGKQKLEAEGVPAEQIFAGDIVESNEVLERSLQGADALIIATSGVPQIKPLSLIGVRNTPALHSGFALLWEACLDEGKDSGLFQCTCPECRSSGRSF